MTHQQPVPPPDEHRVLEFRRRVSGQPPKQPHPTESPPADDLSRYQVSRDTDDFRHRMLANIAAFAFTIALIAVGIWLAASIADMRRTQDCVLMGRRDCARISAP